MRYTKVLLTGVMTAALLAPVATAGAQEKGKKKGGFQLPPMIHISIADFADGGRGRRRPAAEDGHRTRQP